MSNAITAAGSKLFISASLPATYDAAGFEALTWTEVGEMTELPSHGKVYNIINHNPLATRQTIKRKGSYDNGEMTVPYAFDPTGDAGQALLEAAVDSDASYSFRIDIQNPAVNSEYFTAQVTSRPMIIGSVDSIVMMESTLAIDGDVLLEDAYA